MQQPELDLFASEPAVLTVTELNQRARQLLERHLGAVTVAGELSNVKQDASGHVWLCLKDAGAVINAVIFRREARALSASLRAGLQVVASGRLTLYAASGRYQMVIQRLETRGAGALQAAFAALKARLQAEGLFAQARKRPLPALPRRVAIVSSPTGAVIRDIVQVSQRRFPNAQLLLVPVRVQGVECAAQVAAAIIRVGRLAAAERLDVLIVARGGGSLEDLFGFNDEAVARAILACPIPVVSAVGHETDFSIADFVADVRAPTPSAAAELVFPVKSELAFSLQRQLARVGQALRQRLVRQRYRLRALHAELGDGRRPLLLRAQRQAQLLARLEAVLRAQLARRRRRLMAAEQRLAQLGPRARLQAFRARLELLTAVLRRRAPRLTEGRRQQLRAQGQRLEALSPLKILARGYSIVQAADGGVLRRADDAAAGADLQIRLATGRLHVRVTGHGP